MFYVTLYVSVSAYMLRVAEQYACMYMESCPAQNTKHVPKGNNDEDPLGAEYMGHF